MTEDRREKTVPGNGENFIKPCLLITGASGFVGRHLLAHLDTSRYGTVYCLARRREDIQLPDPRPENITTVQGDLLNSSSYESMLDGVDTVIHLAAVTGKAKPSEYSNVNSYASMLLLDRCKKAGVKHFLFVGSIAVSFKNKYRYFYAHSKEKAEEYVKTSGLSFVILRPTMIIGKGSPVFAGLARLAGLPLIPVFGKGTNLIQPIHVLDVVKAIDAIDSGSGYNGETLDLGGPEVIPIKDFMKKIAGFRGKKNPRFFHIPMGMAVFCLSLLERVVYGLLPLTVGQLASFRNDGTAGKNSLMDRLSPHMISLDEMTGDSLDTGKEETAELTVIPPTLVRECKTFCRYLVNQVPNAYVIKKYHLCHEKISFKPEDFHDALLLKLAVKSPFFTRTADAYSRFFRPGSVTRKKLAYLVGILEVTPPYYRYFERVDVKGLLGFLVKGGIKGLGLALHLAISVPVLRPLQAWAKSRRYR